MYRTLCLCVLSLVVLSAELSGQSIVDGFTLDQMSFTASSSGNVPCSEYGQASLAVRQTPGFVQYIQVVAQLAGSQAAPAWIVKNLPAVASMPFPSASVNLAQMGVARGTCVNGSQVSYVITVTDTAATAAPAFTSAQTAYIGSKINHAQGETGGTLGAPSLPPAATSSVAAESIRIAPAANGSGDVGVNVIDRQGMGSVIQGNNQCAPGGVTNSMQWLSSQGSINLGGETPAQTLAKIVSDAGTTASGTSPTQTLMGKLAYSQRAEHPLNLNIHYQADNGLSSVGASVQQGAMTATRDGNDGPPTFEYLQAEMAKGQDVELSIDWLNAAGVKTGGHVVAVSGVATSAFGNGIAITDDENQDGTANGLRMNHWTPVAKNGNYLSLMNEPTNRIKAIFSESPITPHYMIAPLENANQIAIFQVNLFPGNVITPESTRPVAAATVGSLTPITGSPFTGGTNAVASTSVLGRFVYVANFGSNNVSAFTINAATGALTAVPGSPFAAGAGPFAVGSDPAGRFLYVANYTGRTMSAFLIDPTSGALTQITGSPYTMGGGPASATVSPSGRLLFAANYDNGNVSVFSIDPVTGALTNLQGSPFTAGGSPNWVAVHPTGKFAYVVNNGSNDISAYSIGPTGFLTVINSTGYAAGAQASTMAIDPTGQFAYVSNHGTNNVSAYNINLTTGALTPMAGSPFAAGVGPFAVIVDSWGKYVYVSNQGFGAQTISAYTLDSTTGALTQVAGSPFATGNGPARMSIVTVGPTAVTNPLPTVAQVAPSALKPGAGNTLVTLFGSNFVPGSVARINGSPRGTVYISAGQLNVSLSASDVANAGSAQITVSNPAPGGGLSSAATLTVNASAAPPTVPSAGTVNAAGFQPGLAVVPGSIASVFGTNIAAQTTAATSLPLPTSLGNSSMLLNGKTSAPLFFTASGQANVQIPWELAGSQHAFVSYTSANGTGGLASMTLAQFAPGVFTINNAGTGQGVVTLANSTTYAAPAGSISGALTAPVAKGQFVTIYCTGLGAVANQPATGAPAPAGPNLATTITNPVVTIGGLSAPVNFSGLTPGLVGLYQVNAQVPASAPSGAAITLQLTIGGVNANPVTIAIQ